MGRRNHLLIVSLLVMLAVLIGAILSSGGGENAPDDTTKIAAQADGDDPTAEQAADLGDSGARSQGAVGERKPVEGPGAVGTATAGGGPISIRGRLVERDGGPSVDRVLRFSRFLDYGFDSNDEPRELNAGSGEIRTDAEGRFAFEVARGARGILSIDRIANRLYAESGRRDLTIPGYQEDTDLGDLPVQSAGSVVGRVVDENDNAVVGARVRASRDITDIPILVFDGGAVKTDDQGRFEIVGLSTGPKQLQASATGFVPQTGKVKVVPGEVIEGVVLRMTRGASIAGNVVDDRGRAIAGAKVAIFRDREVGEDVSIESLDSGEAVETDENGYFLLSGIEGSSARLRAWANGHAAHQMDQISVGTSNVMIRLSRHGRIAGVLVDTDGKPIEGSRVMASRGLLGVGFDFEDAAFRGARTDAEGRFSIDSVRPGTATLTARGGEHLPVEGYSVQVRAGELTDNVRLVADIGAAVDALVVDAAGVAVPGAKVTVTEQEQPPAGGRSMRTRVRREVDDNGDVAVSIGDGAQKLAEGVTDGEGRVRLAGLPAGEITLKTEHDSHAPSRPTQLSLPRRGAVEAVLTMRAGGFVEVSSVMADGSPAPAARFELRGPIAGADLGASDNHRTDGSGVARIGPLPIGDYDLTMQLPPQPMQVGNNMMFTTDDPGVALEQTRQRVVVTANETTLVKLIKPVLTRLVGTVTDADGVASGIELKVQRADVDSDPIGRRGHNGKSDANGRFQIGELPPGKYRIEFGRPGQIIAQTETVVIQPNQEEAVKDLVLRGGTIRVAAVSVADDLPVDRASVSLERQGEDRGPAPRRGMIMVRMNVEADSEGGNTSTVTMGDGRRSVRTDDDGVAVLEGVPPGKYTVIVRHNKYVVRRIDDVVVTDRQMTDAGTTKLDAAGFLRGTVSGFPPDAMPFALVEIKRADSDDEPRNETAMNAAFSVDSLSPGTYHVRARPLGPDSDGAEWGPISEAVVQAGKAARVNVRLR